MEMFLMKTKEDSETLAHLFKKDGYTVRVSDYWIYVWGWADVTTNERLHNLYTLS